MHTLSCSHCRRSLSFTPTRNESLRRCRQFLKFAAVLAVVALGLHVANAPMWPIWVGGMAVFVLSQAAFKWHESRWTFCNACQRGRYVYVAARSANDE